MEEDLAEVLVRQLKRLATPLLEDGVVGMDALGIVGEIVGSVELGVIGKERSLRDGV